MVVPDPIASWRIPVITVFESSRRRFVLEIEVFSLALAATVFWSSPYCANPRLARLALEHREEIVHEQFDKHQANDGKQG